MLLSSPPGIDTRHGVELGQEGRPQQLMTFERIPHVVELEIGGRPADHAHGGRPQQQGHAAV
jgi:hypothetical protein